MSLRTTQLRYSGGGGSRAPRQSFGSGTFGTTGGISLDPSTNEYIYSPLQQSSTGRILDAIFNRGQAAAGNQALNAQIMAMLLQQQGEHKNKMAEIEGTGKQQKDVEILKQALDIMKKSNVLYSPENKDALDKATSALNIEIAHRQSQTQLDTENDTGYQNAVKRGATAKAEEPIWSNFEKGKLPANTAAFYNPGLMAGSPAMAQGPQVSQGIQRYGGIPMTVNGQTTMIGEKEAPYTQVKPGSTGFPTGLTRNDLIQRQQSMSPSPISTFSNIGAGMGMQQPSIAPSVGGPSVQSASSLPLNSIQDAPASPMLPGVPSNTAGFDSDMMKLKAFIMQMLSNKQSIPGLGSY